MEKIVEKKNIFLWKKTSYKRIYTDEFELFTRSIIQNRRYRS